MAYAGHTLEDNSADWVGDPEQSLVRTNYHQFIHCFIFNFLFSCAKHSTQKCS